MRELKVLITLSKWVWQLFAVLIISLAILVVLGRAAIGNLSDYKKDITDELSLQLGLPVTATSLHGEWQGLNPSFYIKGFTVYADETKTKQVLSGSTISAQPDLIASLWNRKLVLKDLSLGHIKLTLLEEMNGKWSLGGLGFQGGGGNFKALEKLFFKSHRLKIERLSINVLFRTGTKSALQLKQVEIENSNDFHRLKGSAWVDQSEQTAQVIIEGWGYPLDASQFKGKGYFKLNQINNTGLLSAAFHHWLPEQFDKVGNVQTDINAELWLSLNGQGKGSMSGYLQAAELPLNWFEQVEPITNFSAELAGSYHHDKGWVANTQNISFNWQDHAIEQASISYQHTTGDQLGEGVLKFNTVDLALLKQLSLQTGVLPKRTASIIQQLNPKGFVQKLSVALQLRDNNKVEVLVKGNLDDASIASVKKAPAAKHINGYFETTGLEGLLQIDSPDGLAIHYPTAYKNYMQYSSLKGQLNWQINLENEELVLHSGPLQIKGEEGQGLGYLGLNIPLKRANGPGQMMLQIGLKNSHSRYRDRFIPKTLKPALREWLHDSIGDVNITEAGFIWRGSLAKKGNIDRTIQLYLKVANGNLKFHSDWPALDEMGATLTVDDNEVKGDISQAEIAGLNVGKTYVNVLSPTPKRPKLYILGTAAGDVKHGLGLLNHSPLAQQISALNNWSINGKANAFVDLTIPLTRGIQGSYKVDVDITQGNMTDNTQLISFNDIKTRLSYNDKGIFANKITAKLWGKNPLMASLTSTNEKIDISAKTQLNVKDIESAFDWDSGDTLSGNTDISGLLEIPKNSPLSPKLTLTTTLSGVAIDLPQPFTKLADDRHQAELIIRFGTEKWLYQAKLNNLIDVQLSTHEGHIEEGFVLIDSEDRPDNVSGSFLVRGHLDNFNLADWQQVYNRFGHGGALSSLSTDIDLHIETATIAELDFPSVDIQGGIKTSQSHLPQWVFDFASKNADGRVSLPASESQQLNLALTRLLLNFDHEATPQDAGFLASINPADFPTIDFSVEQLLINDRKYGSIGFQLRPFENGAKFKQLSGTLGGIGFGGVDNLETSLTWQQNTNGSQTKFHGLLTAQNLADVFEFWDLPAFMDSKNINLLSDISWQARPDQFHLKYLEGSINISVEKGTFFHSPTAPTNAAIRTLGLFNFANWVRRLRLDFSDFFNKGMSYDTINGGLVFESGTMLFDELIKVKMPSGQMMLSGEADLINEQLNANLVMTLPVSTNLPWIAALAGGLPAAAGVYLTSKVFEKEVDKFSSLSYRLSGPWSEPEVAVDKIFSNKTSKP